MQDLLCNWDEYWHCTIFIWFCTLRINIWYFQALSLVNQSPSLSIRCTQPTTRLETFSVGWFAGNIFVGRFLFWKISTVDDWFKLPANWRYAYHCQFAGNLLDDFGKFRLRMPPCKRSWWLESTCPFHAYPSIFASLPRLILLTFPVYRASFPRL